MAKPEDSGLYTGSLLTLNASSSDEYVKGIYDEWAEKYDKVLPLSVIFPISEGQQVQQTAKQSVFLRIQVRASSQTKGLQRG